MMVHDYMEPILGLFRSPVNVGMLRPCGYDRVERNDVRWWWDKVGIQDGR